MQRKRMTAAQAIVEYLICANVRYVFGIFGHGNVQLGEALAERSDELRFIQAKNEQAAVHMAIGYYRQSGRIAAVTTSTGPGATNMVTGALVAKIGRFPVLLLPGEAFEHRYPRGPVLQEIEGIDTANEVLEPVSVFFKRLTDPADVPYLLRAAFSRMQIVGSEGPAVLTLPMDVQAEAFNFTLSDFVIDEVPTLEAVADDLIVQATMRLMDAKQPIIIAGGGVLRSANAAEYLGQLAMQLEIPVVHTQGGMGALLWDHPYNLTACGPTGTPYGNDYAESADVIFAIGTRLDDFTTSSETLFSEDATFITLNANRFDASKGGAAIQMCGDAGATLLSMLTTIGNRRRMYDEGVILAFNSNIASARTDWFIESDRLRSLPQNDEGLLPQSSVIGILNDVLDDDAVIVAAAGSLPGDLLTLWRASDATRKGYHLEYDASTMGYEIPGAIGVKLADSDRHVVALLGDGSFMMNPTEILTAAQEGLSVTFLVLDSVGHRSIQGCQEGNALQKFGTEYEKRNEDSGLLDGGPLDYNIAAIAQGLGADVITVTSEETLRHALHKAKDAKRPLVILISVDATRTVPNYSFWDVPIPQVSDRPELQEALRTYENNLKRRVVR